MRSPGQRVFQTLTLHQQRNYPAAEGDYWIAHDDRNQFWDLAFVSDQISRSPLLVEELFWQTRDLLNLDLDGIAPFWGLWHDGEHTALVFSHLSPSGQTPQHPNDLRQLDAPTQAGLSGLLSDLHGAQSVFNGPAHGQLSPTWIDAAPGTFSLPFFGAESRILATTGKAPAPSLDRDDHPVMREWLQALSPAGAGVATAVLSPPRTRTAPPLPAALLYSPPLFDHLPALAPPTAAPQPAEQPIYRQSPAAAPTSTPSPAPVTAAPAASAAPYLVTAGLLVLILSGIIGVFLYNRNSGPPPLVSITEPWSALNASALSAAGRPHGSIDLTSTPPGATFLINSVPLDKGIKSQTLPVGRYQIRAIHPGLDPVMQEITLADQEESSILLAFKYGDVNLTSTPPGAQVLSSSGKQLGATPLLLRQRPGEVHYSLEKTGYHPVAVNETVNEGRQLDVKSALLRQTGTLTIESSPPGLDFSLTLTDSDTGDTSELPPLFKHTPYHFTAPTGSYIIEWRRPNAGSESTKTTVLSNQTAIARRTFTDGLVSITADPPGANIFHGTDDLGQAPIQLMLPLEQTTLVAKRNGWPDLTLQATPGVNRDTRYEFDWPHGTLALASDPEGATFYINDVLLGKGAREEDRPVGDYVIRAEHPGLDPVTRKISLADGDQENAKFKFAYGDIILESTPAGATIHDALGKQIGITPTILRQRPGKVNYTIRKPGFDPVTIKETVGEGKNLGVRIKLERN